VIRRVRVDRYVVLIVVVVFATACSESLQHPDRDPQTEELVRQYLTDNPGFLLDNPEFLAGVRAVAQAREERRQALARRALLDARANINSQVTVSDGTNCGTALVTACAIVFFCTL